MSVTRFFRMLDVRLSEDTNCTAVELFDIHHAETVLAAFGRAFGALPVRRGRRRKTRKRSSRSLSPSCHKRAR